MQDIVYIVRPGENNEELRYSLRSLEKNFPNHGTVWIIGYKPTWVQHVRTIHKTQVGTKYVNSHRNLMAACNHPDISEDFILMNDDFFIMQPITEIPRYNRGPIQDVIKELEAIGSGRYVWSMRHTLEYLKKIKQKDPLSYELHVPMIINKKLYLEAIKQRNEVEPTVPRINKRTVYGNYVGYGGETIEDVKVSFVNARPIRKKIPFLSTDDKSFRFGTIGNYIKDQFYQQCRYETIA